MNEKRREIDLFLPLPGIYGKKIKLKIEDEEKVKLYSWLRKDVSLRILRKNKVFMDINKGKRYLIKVHLRNERESPILDYSDY